LPRMAYTLRSGSPISPRKNTQYKTLTSEIDVPCLRQFPEIRRKSIGTREKLQFYDMPDGPGTLPRPLADTMGKGVRIGVRSKERPENIPGPGEYSPSWDEPPKLCSMNKAFTQRSLWPVSDTPAPTRYTPYRDMGDNPKWLGAFRPAKVPLYDGP
jgi:hypothetical protein